MRAAISARTPIDDEFIYELSRAIPEYAFERDQRGSLIVASNDTDGGRKSGEAYYQVRRWSETTGAAGQTFDSSSGFRLRDGSLVSPGAAWLSDAWIAALDPERRRGYWHVCPQIVVEVASASDRWADVCAKIDRYVENGADYALAVDPEAGAMYERGTPPATLQTAAIATAISRA